MKLWVSKPKKLRRLSDRHREMVIKNHELRNIFDRSDRTFESIPSYFMLELLRWKHSIKEYMNDFRCSEDSPYREEDTRFKFGGWAHCLKEIEKQYPEPTPQKNRITPSQTEALKRSFLDLRASLPMRLCKENCF